MKTKVSGSMTKANQNPKKHMKLMDVLRSIFVRPPPKKSKRAQPLQRMNYIDFRGGGRRGP